MNASTSGTGGASNGDANTISHSSHSRGDPNKNDNAIFHILSQGGIFDNVEILFTFR